MKFSPVFIALLFLSGCAVFEPPEAAPACPEPVACPACEVMQCPEPAVEIVERIVEVPAPIPPQASTAGEMHLPIVGAVEWVYVEPAGLRLEARLDTGAETTSIHAENIRLVEKEGKRYVRFIVPDAATGDQVNMELRLRRQVLIKQHSGEPERRYVVRMWLTLGEMRSRVDVTLSDRQVFEYSLLVGRNFLVDTAIVDVSRRHTQAM
ncbi:ATP-dependent zinc protease [Halioglobus maricola]|nr:ATP-dependent zinc protease [Halioglobus maricola]